MNQTVDSDVRRIDGDVDLRAMHNMAPEFYPFLLQSTARDATLGRFDILFAAPGESLVLDAIGGLSKSGGFLGALDDWWRRERHAVANPRLPFAGGWFVYLGYELAAEIEPALSLHHDPVLPVAFAVRCPAAIIRDHVHAACWLVCEQDAGIDEDRILGDIAECSIVEDEQPVSLDEAMSSSFCGHVDIAEDDAALFIDAVSRAKELIASGDIYQANLSRGWTIGFDGVPDVNRIYDALCRANPGPFAGLMRWQDTTVISSSPERLLRVRDGQVATRPIAGTRPRSAVQSVDDGLSAELFAHPKERAEHIMLIDLERNDLGRICLPGTVEVDEMMVLESYADVHHIVSNVSGRLRPGITPGESIRAVFPGGTITGCPKVRCMQVIRELENAVRGAYTGSFGYLNRDGNLDLNILIRTMVQKGRQITFRAGSGIVADSVPADELAETRAKAKGMLRALRS